MSKTRLCLDQKRKPHVGTSHSFCILNRCMWLRERLARGVFDFNACTSITSLQSRRIGFRATFPLIPTVTDEENKTKGTHYDTIFNILYSKNSLLFTIHPLSAISCVMGVCAGSSRCCRDLHTLSLPECAIVSIVGEVLFHSLCIVCFVFFYQTFHLQTRFKKRLMHYSTFRDGLY